MVLRVGWRNFIYFYFYGSKGRVEIWKHIYRCNLLFFYSFIYIYIYIYIIFLCGQQKTVVHDSMYRCGPYMFCTEGVVLGSTLLSATWSAEVLNPKFATTIKIIVCKIRQLVSHSIWNFAPEKKKKKKKKKKSTKLKCQIIHPLHLFYFWTAHLIFIIYF